MLRSCSLVCACSLIFLAAGGQAQSGPATTPADQPAVGAVFDLAESGYNRVEGLPFLIGIRGRSGGGAQFRGEAALIVRSDPTEGLAQAGLRARVERDLPWSGFVAGLTGFTRVTPIEERGLSALDNSLPALVVRRDYRDYYETRGGAAFLRYAPEGGWWRVGAVVGTERHSALQAGQAASLIDNGRPWRPQALVAQGWNQTVGLGLRLDNRDRRQVLAAGWVLVADLTLKVGGRLESPLIRDRTTGTDLTLPNFAEQFAVGLVDLRRYTNVGNLRVLLRGAVGGTPGDNVLPPQWQSALGGRGTLPGLDGFAHRLVDFDRGTTSAANERALDCGARLDRVFAPTTSFGNIDFYPYYGCDRYAILQAQVEGYLGVRFGEDISTPTPQLDFNLELVPRWVLFFDAGRAWANGPLGPFPRGDEDWAADVGAGIAFGDLGFYAALPLQGPGDRAVRWHVRFGSRL